MKERHDHWCGCHFEEGSVLSQRREKAPLYPVPRLVLPLRRHVCGPHCTEADPDSPHRQDWRPADGFDRAPVRLSCGHVVVPGYVHSCGPRPVKPVLFRGLG